MTPATVGSTVTIFVKAPTNDLKRQREDVARLVKEKFDFSKATRRVGCFLDDEDWQGLKDSAGIANKGVFTTLVPQPDFLRLPPLHIAEFAFPEARPAFDDLIYLHGSTSENTIGLVLTLAHELQHFVQRSARPRLWAANTLISNLLIHDVPKEQVAELDLTWCDVPHEFEARLVSKSIAARMFHANEVQRFIDQQIRHRVTDSDARDWTCIRAIETATEYDLDSETQRFFARFPSLKTYRSRLHAALTSLRARDPNYPEVDIDELLDGAKT